MNKSTIQQIIEQNPDKVLIPIGKNKVPLCSWQDKSRDDLLLQIERLVEDEDKIYGLAWRLPEDILVLDFDKKYVGDVLINSSNVFKLFIEHCCKQTRVVVTGSNGYHVYFKTTQKYGTKYETDNSHIDILQQNRYVMLPKSVYTGCSKTIKCSNCKNGKSPCIYKNTTYKLVNDLPIMELDIDSMSNEHPLKKDLCTILNVPYVIEDDDDIDEQQETNTEDLTSDPLYGLSINHWHGFVDTLGDLSNGDYNTWNTTMMCLYNIFENHSERDNIIHDFSSLSSKYNRRETNTKIASYKSNREHKVKLTRLLELCKEHGIDTSIFKSKSKSIIDKLLEYRDSDYYVSDFIKQLQNQKTPWKLQDLEHFVKQNMHKVVFFKYGETQNVYIKKSKDDYCSFSKHLAHLQKSFYYECMIKGEIKIVETTVNAILSMFNLDVLYVNDYVYNPDPNYIQNENTLNLWTGFQAKPVENINMELIQPILDHILMVWCNDNQEYYDYIINWLRHIYVKPHIKTKVNVVLQSTEQQIGKGILITRFLIPLLFGYKYAVQYNTLNQVTHKFNQHLMNKFFINLDELSDMNGDNFRSKFDIIKNLTTENTLNIEIKNGPQFTHPNYMNILMCTNHLHTIKIEKSDARYFVLECNPLRKGDTEYFNQLETCFTQECANHFARYLVDYKTIVNIRHIPMTKLKQDMIESQKDSVEQFIDTIKEHIENKTIEQELDVDSGRVKSNDLYEYYVRYCSTSGEKPYTRTRFGVRISSEFEKVKSNCIKYILF